MIFTKSLFTATAAIVGNGNLNLVDNIPMQNTYKRLEAWGRALPPRPLIQQKKGANYLIAIQQKLRDAGIRSHVCVGCRSSTLYDKNNKPYRIDNVFATPFEIESVIAEIKKVNSAV